MLIVVIYHCMLFWTGSWFNQTPVFSAEPLAWVCRWMNSFHIYGFTFVSGYLFYFLRVEKGKYPSFGGFAANKAKRLLVPYVAVSALWVIPFAVAFFAPNLDAILKNYLFGISPSQLWFLLMLFFVFMFFYPLCDFFAKHVFGGAIVAALFYGVGIVGVMVCPNVFQIFRACTYLPLFWLGFKVRQYGSRLLRRIPVFVWLLADILLFLLVEYLGKQPGRFFTLLELAFSFLLHAVGATMAFAGLQKLADCVRWKENKVFSFFSRNSMSVYLFHQQVIYLCLAWFNGLLNPYPHVAVNFVIAMAVSLGVSVILRKFKVTAFLIGEK